MTRAEIAAFTYEDDELGTLDGWAALRRRAWKIGMYGEPRDAMPAIKFLHERAYGMARPVEPEQTALTDEQYEEELNLITRERIAKMSPEEKFRLLAGSSENSAPDGQVQ
jgi:hypothetical protein